MLLTIESSIQEPSASYKVEDWIPLVKSICARFVRAKRKIEFSEEFSDGLLGLWQATMNYEPHFGAFSTFAYECIRNKILDGIRRRKAEKKLEQPIDADMKAKDIVDFSLLRKLVEDDPSDTEQYKRDKRIIREFFFEGKSLTDIAKEMKCTLGYVCNCKRYGLDRLKGRIEHG